MLQHLKILPIPKCIAVMIAVMIIIVPRFIAGFLSSCPHTLHPSIRKLLGELNWKKKKQQKGELLLLSLNILS